MEAVLVSAPVANHVSRPITPRSSSNAANVVIIPVRERRRAAVNVFMRHRLSLMLAGGFTSSIG